MYVYQVIELFMNVYVRDKRKFVLAIKKVQAVSCPKAALSSHRRN